jgi:hypothetical protein
MKYLLRYSQCTIEIQPMQHAHLISRIMGIFGTDEMWDLVSIQKMMLKM